MTFLRTYKTEIALALLALVVHLVCFSFVVQVNGSVLDAVRADDGFYELAENVLAGHGFSWSTMEPYVPNPLRTPGYPYVLAALIGMVGVLGAALIQLFAASLLPVLGMKIAGQMVHSRRIEIGVGVLLALDPTLALLSFQFYTETLFLILFFLWLLVSLQYLKEESLKTLVLGAALLGCAILVRASVQFIPILFAAFILFQLGRKNVMRALTHTSIYLVIIGAILTPWILRNATLFGVPSLSAQSAFVLYTNLAPAVLSVAHHTAFADELSTYLTEEEFKGDAITPANARAYTTKAFEVVRTYKTATLIVAGKSLFTFFTNDGFYTLLSRVGKTPTDYMPLLVVARLFWIALTLSAFIGAFLFLKQERSPRTVLLVLLVIYFALTSTIAAFGTNPRYRLPVDPVIIALAGLGGAALYERGSRFLPKL